MLYNFFFLNKLIFLFSKGAFKLLKCDHTVHYIWQENENVHLKLKIVEVEADRDVKLRRLDLQAKDMSRKPVPILRSSVHSTSPSTPKVLLKSDLVTGIDNLGVCFHLPFEGVGLVLGNDLAGHQVFPRPTAVSNDNFSDASSASSESAVAQIQLKKFRNLC